MNRAIQRVRRWFELLKSALRGLFRGQRRAGPEPGKIKAEHVGKPTPLIAQQVDYEFHVEKPPQHVMTFLWDTEALALCVPGCEEVRTIEDRKRYSARIRRHVGPFLIRMVMDIETEESGEGNRVVANVTGRDERLRTDVRQRVVVVVEGAQEGSRVRIDSRFELSGVLATLGWTLLSGHLYGELRQFGANVQSKITTG